MNQVDTNNWLKTPITWAKTRDWFIRKRAALAISIGIATLVWGVAVEIGHPFRHVPLPAGAHNVHYAQGQDYTAMQLGEVLTLTRIPDIGIQCSLFFFTLLIVFFPADLLLQHFNTQTANKYKQHHIQLSQRSFLTRVVRIFTPLVLPTLMLAMFGYYDYYSLLPAFNIIAHPQVIRFDPPDDMVFLNGRVLGRISEIHDFFGVHKRYGRVDWGEWGVDLKDGRYFIFSSGMFDYYVITTANYMNTYLKQYPPHQVMHSSSNPQH